MKKLFVLAAVAAVAMTGCSNENGNNGAVSGNEITMRAILNKNATRASAMTTERFSNFHAIAFHDEAPVSTKPYLNTAVWYDITPTNTSSTGWSYAPKVYWPSSGILNFFAYSPIGDRNMSNIVFNDGFTFDYAVPANQNPTQQQIGGIHVAEDLLVSSLLGKIKTDGIMVFTFEHALSAATFSARNDNLDNQELVYVITDIELTNLYTTGTFDYTSWANHGDQTDYIAPLPEGGVAVEPIATMGEVQFTPLLTKNDFLIIMPQETPNDTKVVITYKLRDGNGNYISDGTIPLEFDLQNFEFKKGTQYNFQFIFKALEPIKMDVIEVKGWDDPATPPTPFPQP